MPQSNNDFANAQVISGDTGSVGPVTIDGTDTMEAGEFNEFGATRSIWYQWTAPSTGQFIFTTADSPRSNGNASGLDTILAVFAPGAAPAGPARASDDDGSTGVYNYNSRVVFSATAGEVLHIQVAFYGGTSGIGTLNLSWAPAPPPPPLGTWVYFPTFGGMVADMGPYLGPSGDYPAIPTFFPEEYAEVDWIVAAPNGDGTPNASSDGGSFIYRSTLGGASTSGTFGNIPTSGLNFFVAVYDFPYNAFTPNHTAAELTPPAYATGGTAPNPTPPVPIPPGYIFYGGDLVADLGLYDGSFPVEPPKILPDGATHIYWLVGMPHPSIAGAYQSPFTWTLRTNPGGVETYQPGGNLSLPVGGHFFVLIGNDSNTVFDPGVTPEQAGAYTHGERPVILSEPVQTPDLLLAPASSARTSQSTEALYSSGPSSPDPDHYYPPGPLVPLWDQVVLNPGTAPDWPETAFSTSGFAAGVPAWFHTHYRFGNSTEDWEASVVVSTASFDFQSLRGRLETLPLPAEPFVGLRYGIDYELMPDGTTGAFDPGEPEILPSGGELRVVSRGLSFYGGRFDVEGNPQESSRVPARSARFYTDNSLSATSLPHAPYGTDDVAGLTHSFDLDTDYQYGGSGGGSTLTTFPAYDPNVQLGGGDTLGFVIILEQLFDGVPAEMQRTNVKVPQGTLTRHELLTYTVAPKVLTRPPTFRYRRLSPIPVVEPRTRVCFHLGR